MEYLSDRNCFQRHCALLKTVEELSQHIELADQIYSRQVSVHVEVGIFGNKRILIQRLQNEFSLSKDHANWNKQNCKYESASIQVQTTQLQISLSVGLGHESFQSQI